MIAGAGGKVDKEFQPAVAAIDAGDVQRLRDLVRSDPALATS